MVVKFIIFQKRRFFIKRIRMSYVQRRKAMPIQVELADFKVAPFPIS